MLRVLLGRVRELPGRRHDLEEDQDPKQQHEEDPEKGYRSMAQSPYIDYRLSSIDHQ
jgi:hypothetical protein